MQTVKKTTSENELAGLVNEWAEAVRVKDFDKIMSHYAKDVVAFDVPPPLQINGSDAVRQNMVNWLNMFDGPADVEFKDLEITASDDLAFLRTLTSVTPKGSGQHSWVRVTVCYRKIDGNWLVTHEHASLPFNGETSVEGLKS
ncbi:MAG TPA: nuclear transport factor 2 family protein [Pyrinomonadaceae bacterium]|nr:nuclear transport factor 2 family protein [Pyrinomonadaceae bacterium]